jgi:hypothetical protein
MRYSVLRAVVLGVLSAAIILGASAGDAVAGGPPPPGGGPPPPPPGAPHPFTDTSTSQFQLEIAWLYNDGITGGCAATRFCPTGQVTREQMASFLVRALGLPTTAGNFFSDDNGSLHEGDINRLAASGVTGGCAPSRFCPSGAVTRAQMASFLVRALGLPSSGSDRFTDDGASVHEADINALAASGITGGCSATRFCPSAPVTRGQMAAFLFRGLAESSPVLPAGTGTGMTTAGGVIAGQGLPGPPVATLVCGAGVVWVSGPSVFADQGLAGQSLYVSWIPRLLRWDGANWQHAVWHDWHYSFVTNSGAGPGSSIGSANPPWARYGGGHVVYAGQGLLFTTPSGIWAVGNFVQDNFGDTNFAPALTDGGSYWCQN